MLEYSDLRDRIGTMLTTVGNDIRHGRWEQVVLALCTLLTLMWMSSNSWMDMLVDESWHRLVNSALVAAILVCCAVLILLKVRRTKPAASEVALPVESKGAFSYSEHDAQLYRDLGRNDEIAQIAAFMRDSEVSLIVVSGPSGVGKSSLVRAGITIAKQTVGYDVESVYWQAVPVEPERHLLKAIGSNNLSNSANMEDLRTTLAGRSRLPRLFILDQFERLSPTRNREFFDVIRHVISQRPPFRSKLIVVFRFDFQWHWEKFVNSIDDLGRLGVRVLRVEPFSRPVAEMVLLRLLTSLEVEISEKVRIKIVDEISDDGEVLPVMLSVAAAMLYRLSKNMPERICEDTFKTYGGSEGLLTEYLNQELYGLSEEKRELAIVVLLRFSEQLIDKEFTTGLSADDVAKELGKEKNKILHVCSYLSDPSRRIIEGIPDGRQTRYRVPHERLALAARRLGGLHLAEEERALRLFNRRYELWRFHGVRANYLRGRELRDVEKHLPNRSLGRDAQEKRRFLSKSIRDRNHVRIFKFAVGSFALVGLLLGWISFEREKMRQRFEAWQLPGELLELGPQLHGLALSGFPVNRLDWIPQNLTGLTISSANIQDFETLPNAFRMLILYGTYDLARISDLNCSFNRKQNSLDGIEKFPAIEGLKVSGAKVVDFSGIQNHSSLKKLDVSSGDFENLDFLPSLPALDTLRIGYNEIKTLNGIERFPALTTLDISGNVLESLDGIVSATALTTLQMTASDEETFEALAKLPSLKTLVLSKVSFDSLKAMNNLTALEVLEVTADHRTNLSPLEALPEKVALKLHVDAVGRVAGLERLLSLVELDIRMGVRMNLSGSIGSEVIAGIENLPNLTALRLANVELTDLVDFSKLEGLEELSLNNCNLESLRGIEGLISISKLELNGNSIRTLKGLATMPNLRSLSVRANQIETIDGIESFPLLENLDVAENNLSGLAGVESLSSLIQLNVGGNAITDLSPLEKLSNLSELTIKSVTSKPIVGLEKLHALERLSIDNESAQRVGLPPNIQWLYLSDVANRSLPEIPFSVKELYLYQSSW